MRRTVGTIVGEGEGVGVVSLIHDDETHTLIGRDAQGREHTIDSPPLRTPLTARAFAVASWGKGRAYHDVWTLCLRPVDALRTMRSEATT